MSNFSFWFLLRKIDWQKLPKTAKAFDCLEQNSESLNKIARSCRVVRFFLKNGHSFHQNCLLHLTYQNIIWELTTSIKLLGHRTLRFVPCNVILIGGNCQKMRFFSLALLNKLKIFEITVQNLPSEVSIIILPTVRHHSKTKIIE